MMVRVLRKGFILEKKIGVGQPKRLENPKILIANTAMDTDKIKIFSAKVRVDSISAVAAIEDAEKVQESSVCVCVWCCVCVVCVCVCCGLICSVLCYRKKC